MSTPPVPAMSPVDRPVFVLGERTAAVQLVRALGDTPTLCAMSANRLLYDLVQALERCSRDLEPLIGSAHEDPQFPATWYRDVQAARLRGSGKTRTVEFSGLSILRLCELFPRAQFLIVRHLKRAIPPSRRLPAPELGRILEIDSEWVTTPGTLECVLSFLGESTEPVELDLSDTAANGARLPAGTVSGYRRRDIAARLAGLDGK
jgi:hypothetical protein